MYTVDCKVKGVSPLIQHRFPIPDPEDASKGGRKSTGAIDYSEEWREYFYATAEGMIYQPATHFEGAMVKAAVNFKVVGKRGKTYKDLFSASVFVLPDQIPHNITVPDELGTDGDQPLYLDVRPVVVNRARVIRIRPAFSPGWILEFDIEVIDDQIHPELVHDILTLAGKTVGIGDFRPKFGRFEVIRFEADR